MFNHSKYQQFVHLLFALTTLCLISACNQDEGNKIESDIGPKNVSQLVNPVTPNGTRYQDLVFAEVKATRDVVYGQNTDQAGTSVTLKMNIFEPANDQAQHRPLVILAHGGGFTEGTKEGFDSSATSVVE